MTATERELADALADVLREIRKVGGRMPDGFDWTPVRNAEICLGHAAPIGVQPSVRDRMAAALTDLGPFYALAEGLSVKIYSARDGALIWHGTTHWPAHPGDKVNFDLPNGAKCEVEVRKP